MPDNNISVQLQVKLSFTIRSAWHKSFRVISRTHTCHTKYSTPQAVNLNGLWQAERICGRFQWVYSYPTVTFFLYIFRAANLIALTQGLQVGWVSTTLPSLASDDTPLLSGPITNDQLSWIGSINCIGALIGSFSVGYLTNVLGSKRTVHFLAVPYAISWLLIYFGNTYQHILLARFVFKRKTNRFPPIADPWILWSFFFVSSKVYRWNGRCWCWEHCTFICRGNCKRWVCVFNLTVAKQV